MALIMFGAPWLAEALAAATEEERRLAMLRAVSSPEDLDGWLAEVERLAGIVEKRQRERPEDLLRGRTPRTLACEVVLYRVTRGEILSQPGH